MSISNSNPRLQAVKEITSILNGDNYKSINSKDAFYRSLISETIRRLGEIDFYLKKYIKKPLKTEQNYIKANLIVGAAQILYMRVPSYAAVNDSVEIAKANAPHHVKFINAVLRQLCRDTENNRLDKLSSLVNLPIEIMNKWIKRNDDKIRYPTSPPKVKLIKIDYKSGFLPSKKCFGKIISEAFVEGTEPTEKCS